MGSQAFAGVGTKFQRWNGTTWDDIAEINAIEGPGMTKDTLEVTSLDTDAGYNEFITGFAEGGTVTLDMNFTRETYELMKDDFESDVVQNYRIQLADYDSEPSTFTFGGLVIELPMGISADDKVTADVVIQVTSQVILDIGSTVPEDEAEAPQRTSQVIQDATSNRLDINYNQTLDSGSVPAASAFAVVVAGSARTVNSVAISASQVRLTLASAVTYGQVVTVAYTVPGSNPIQNEAGVDASSFGAVSVTNNVAAPLESSSGALLAELEDGNTVAYYDYRQGVTVEDTDKVITLEDIMGNSGMDIFELGDSDDSRPTLTSSGILFDGIDDIMEMKDTFSVNQPYTVYFVYKIVSFTANRRMVSFLSNAGVDLRQYGTGGRIGFNTSSAVSIATEYSTLGERAIAVGILNGASSSIELNGRTAVGGDLGTRIMNKITLGGDFAYGNKANFEFVALIVRAGVDNSTKKAAIWNALNDDLVHNPIEANVEDATPTRIDLVFNEALDENTISEIAPTDFGVTLRTVNSLTLSADHKTLYLGLTSPIDQAWSGQVIFTQSSAGGILTAGGDPVPYMWVPVVNNVID